MKIANTLEELLKNREHKNGNTTDSYEDYKRKNGLYDTRGYVDAVNAIYAASKKDLSSYGANNRKLSNKGLQNSGYADYIDALSQSDFNSKLTQIKDIYKTKEADAALGYAEYLEKEKMKSAKLKNSVMSHLIKNGVVDLSTAVAYGMSAGLSQEDAESIGKSAYEVTKQKVFNSILEQTVRLGLDSEGARQLAIKMGVSEGDAQGFADEISELLDYYGNISEEYLEFLKQRSN